MNGFLRNIWCAFLIVAAIVATGCKEKDPAIDPIIPEIGISDVKATSSSVTFTVTTKEAVKFTYYVSAPGTVGTPTEVAKQAETLTVTGLGADQKYVIVAFAQSSDGNKSNEEKHEFTTNAKAKIAIGDITTTPTSATVTLTPTNATKYYYVCYPAAAQKPDYIEVVGNEPKPVTFADLTPETEYKIEAYAINAEGSSAVESKSFNTSEKPKILSVKSIPMEQFTAVHFEFDKQQAMGYYYTDPIDLSDPNASPKTLSEFIKSLETGHSYLYHDALKSSWVKAFKSGTVFAVCANTVDDTSVIMKDTGIAVPITTGGAVDVIGSGSADASIVSLTPMATLLKARISFPENAIMYVGLVVGKKNVTNTIEEYVNQNLATLMQQSCTILDNPGEINIEVAGLSSITEYYYALVAVDNQGKLGKLTTKEFTTPSPSYDPKVTVAVTVGTDNISRITFNVKTTGAYKDIRVLNISEDVFQDQYNSDDNAVVAQLFNPESEKMDFSMDKTHTCSNLVFGGQYRLYALPVKADGSFGTPMIHPFDAFNYNPKTAAGTATVKATYLKSVFEWNEYHVYYKLEPSSSTVMKHITCPVDAAIYDENPDAVWKYVFEGVDKFISHQNFGGATREENYNIGSWHNLRFIAIACDENGNWGQPTILDEFDPTPAN